MVRKLNYLYRQIRKIRKKVFKTKSAKSNTGEYSTLGNYLLKNEFGERRPARSGGWRMSRRLSRVLRFREMKYANSPRPAAL